MNTALFCYLALWKRPDRMAEIAALVPEPARAELQKRIEEFRQIDAKELPSFVAGAIEEHDGATPAGVPLDHLPPAFRKWFQPWTTK